MAACNSPKKLQRHVHNQILSPPSTSQLSFSRTNLLPSHRHLPVVIAECRLHSVLITSLDCRFCMLNKLSITTLCSHLVNLEELKVVDCGLKELDQGIPWPDRLKCIDFSRNQLIQCPQGISSLLYLQTLNLSGNLIQQLDPSLLRLPLLHSLHVLCNPIQNVPKHICRSGVFKLREYFDTNVLPLPQPSISLATTNPLPISNGLRNPPSVVDLKRCQDLRRLLLRQQGSFDSGYESSRRCRSTSGSSIETVDSDLTDPTLCPLLQHFQLPEGYSPAVKTTLCQVFLPEDCADGVKVEVVKDLSLHPDVRPNELLVTPVVQITPHGRTFTTEQPAIVVLPHCTKQGSGSGTRPHLVPVCSDSRLSQPTAWGKLDGDPSCEMFQDHIVFKTTHFSLFAVLAVLPYPSASKTISPDYGGLLIVPELPGFEVSLPPTLSHTLTVTATVYYDDAPYIIEGDGKTLASPCVGLEPHGATFDAPVSISLPIPNYKEITAKFPNAKLELWYAPEEESESSLCPKKWTPFDNVNISIEERSTGHVLVFTTDHFSWWETLWDIGRQALRKVGLLPAINDESRTRYISVRVQAFMSPPMKWGGRGGSDVQTFGLLVAVYKFGNPLSQLSNYPWSLLDTGTKRIFLQLGRLEVSIQGCFSAQEYEDPTSPLTRSSELIEFNGDDFCHRFEFALRVDPGCELREGLLMGKLYFKQWNGPTPRRQDYNLIIKHGSAEMTTTRQPTQVIPFTPFQQPPLSYPDFTPPWSPESDTQMMESEEVFLGEPSTASSNVMLPSIDTRGDYTLSRKRALNPTPSGGAKRRLLCRQGDIDERTLLRIADAVGSKYTELGIELGLNYKWIQSNVENKASMNRDNLKALHILHEWRMRAGPEFSYVELAKALEADQIGLRSVAVDVCYTNS